MSVSPQRKTPTLLRLARYVNRLVAVQADRIRVEKNSPLDSVQLSSIYRQPDTLMSSCGHPGASLSEITQREVAE